MKWEYIILNEPDAVILADTGQNGWELVSIDPRVQGLRESRYVFKRLIRDVPGLDAQTIGMMDNPPPKRPRGRPPKLRLLDAN